MRHCFFLILVFTLFSLLSLACAAEDPEEGCDFTGDTMVRFPSNMGSAGPNAQLRTPPDLPIGGTISTGYGRLEFYCAFNIAMLLTRPDYDGRGVDTQKIYKTNIDGVGMRIMIKDIVTDALNPPHIAGIGTQLKASLATPGIRFNATIQVDLVKIADTPLDGHLGGEIFRVIFEENNEEILSTSIFFSPTILANAGCTVISKDVAVNMGCITVSQLTGKMPATLGTGLTIWLNCTKGTRALIAFADASNPANRTDILSLSKDSTALGVGIRLSKIDASSIFYSTDSTAIGLYGQTPVAASEEGGIIMIPLNARYVRTAKVVSAGSVNALTTFTLAYQ